VGGFLQIDQSLSHNGVCLTVEQVGGGQHQVTAIEETLKKTTLGSWTKGQRLNLERCLQLHDRLDGHLVQGHVDTRALCTEREALEGSWQFGFQIPKAFAALVIEKGSISVDGISLTLFDVGKKRFRVAVIPYTYAHTNIQALTPGMEVNIEFDLLGKYIQRQMTLGKA